MHAKPRILLTSSDFYLMSEVTDYDCKLKKRQEKIDQLKGVFRKIDENLLILAEELNWDYSKLVNETPENMVICSINSQHKAPASKINSHEEKCAWYAESYQDDDKTFSEFSGYGSFVTFNPDLIKSITNSIPSGTNLENRNLRSVPQTSANFDQNFNREEKLAIYDYVIANTQQQKAFSNLIHEPFEKKEQRRELEPWEIAAAERDAKRRRASYRNKVHTNRKTHTEVIREVIEVQMEALKETIATETVAAEKHNSKKYKNTNRDKEKDQRYADRKQDKEDKHDKHKSKYSNRPKKRSPPNAESDYHSRSRLYDKHGKWKSFKERSYHHKSNHSYKKN